MGTIVTETPVLRSPHAGDFSPQRQAALERLFGALGELACLPAASTRVLELTAGEDSDAEALRDSVQTDPVLVAKILRRINSSYYGLSNKVSDLRTAVSLLGFREIRNLVLTVSVSKFYEKSGNHGPYRRERLWEHCVAVGAASQLVSRVCGRATADEAYVAGLLHDLGLILIDQNLRRHFCQILDQLNPSVSTCDLEIRTLSFDHAMLGGFVAQKWRLPDPVVDAIAFHHQPERYTGQYRDLVNVVAVANYLCSRAGWSSLGVHNLPTPDDSVLAGLGLDQVTLAIIWEQLDATLQRADAMATG